VKKDGFNDWSNYSFPLFSKGFQLALAVDNMGDKSPKPYRFKESCIFMPLWEKFDDVRCLAAGVKTMMVQCNASA